MSSPATAAATARLFLALWPGDEVRAALRSLQQQWWWPDGAALVAPQKLHLTLHFLGQVPLARIGQFRDRLSVPGERHALDLAHARHAKWHGGLAVMELSAPPALQRLHAALAQALRALDWPVEDRPYRPHVTFARRAFAARPPEAPSTPLPEWPVETGYVLVRSVPSHGYEVLHVYGAQ